MLLRHVNRLIRQSKRKYYLSYFNKFKHNFKKIWSGIRNILDLEKYKSNSNICLTTESQFITSQAQVANTFNLFLINVAQNLVSKLGNTNKSFKDYLQEPQYEKFFMKPVTYYEVSDLIKNLDESKSPDPYNIPVKLIKLIPYNMSGALTDIFNESFKTGIFPDLLKLAHVTPTHKGNSRLTVTNNRQISVLPIISKVFEQIVHKRVYDFFISDNIIFEHQFGFQKNRSTSLAILGIYFKLIKSKENKKFSCCIFLDFAKAFDTVTHEILLSKLEHYGIAGIERYRTWGYQDNFQFDGNVDPLECIFMALLALFNEGVPAHVFHLIEAPMMGLPNVKMLLCWPSRMQIYGFVENHTFLEQFVSMGVRDHFPTCWNCWLEFFVGIF